MHLCALRQIEPLVFLWYGESEAPLRKNFVAKILIFERNAVQNYEEYPDILNNFGQVVAENQKL